MINEYYIKKINFQELNKTVNFYKKNFFIKLLLNFFSVLS